MNYPMYNRDFDVIYQCLSESIRRTADCSHAHIDNENAVEDLIHMAEIVIKNLKRLDLRDELIEEDL